MSFSLRNKISVLAACALLILNVGCADSNQILAWLRPSSSKTITAQPLDLTPGTSLTMIAGESLAFSASGGRAPYVWTDGGLGYFSVDGVFQIPLNAVPATVTARLTDASGAELTRSIKIQSFSSKTETASTALGVSRVGLNSIVEFGSDLLGVSSVQPYDSVGFFDPRMKNYFLSVHKSSDNGMTWTVISKVQPVPGLTFHDAELIVSGSTLYLVGSSGSETRYASTVILSSIDGGVTWTTRLSIPAEPTFTSLNVTAGVATADGAILYSVSAYQPAAPNEHKVILRKCNVTTFACVDVETTNGVGSYRGFTRGLFKDTSGNLYAGMIVGIAGPSRAIRIKKSVDNGTTWTLLRQDASPNHSFAAFAVSSDGQSLLYGGTISVAPPFSRESIDGGATWTALSSNCPGWSNITAVYNSGKAAMISCYDFNSYASGYTGFISRKAFGATAWTNVQITAGDSGAYLHIRSNGDVFSMTSLGTLQRTSNLGTTWTTVTVPALTAVHGDAPLTGLVQNGTAFYATGHDTPTPRVRRAILKKSTDDGTTWTTDLTHGTGVHSTFFGIAKSPTTQSMVAIGLQDTNNWIAYRYNPIALTWSLAENFANGAASASTVNAVVAGATGTYYAAGGYRAIAGGNFHSYLRRSTDDGVTWAAFDDYVYAANFDSEALSATASGTELYLAGYGVDASSRSHWLVRKWDGSAWSVIDDETFQADTTAAKARAVLKTADGILYVAGEYTTAALVRHWVVKKKTATGSWQVVDDFVLATDGDAYPTSIIDDSTGRIFVSGKATNASGVTYAVTRVFSNGAWSTVDQYTNIWGGSAAAAIRCYSAQVCLVGTSANADHQQRGFLRILSP